MLRFEVESPGIFPLQTQIVVRKEPMRDETGRR